MCNSIPSAHGGMFLVHWRGWTYPSWRRWSTTNMSEVCDRDGHWQVVGNFRCVSSWGGWAWFMCMCLCAGSAYDCIPTSTASYIILLRGAFCWMMGSLKGSGASNMLLIGHVSSFSSCFFKHLYSLSDLGVNMVDEVFGIFSTRDLSSFEIWPFQLS